MKKLSNAELAVLGLIVERAMHGYELEAVIQERGMRNWTEIGFSSIYRILASLEKSGLIGSRMESAPGKGPARRVYEAKKTGKKRYEAEALEALSLAERSYPAFMQGLAALPYFDAVAAAAALARYGRGLADRLAEVQAKNTPGLPFHVAAMFSYSETMIRAEADWVSDLEARLRAAAEEGER